MTALPATPKELCAVNEISSSASKSLFADTKLEPEEGTCLFTVSFLRLIFCIFFPFFIADCTNKVFYCVSLFRSRSLMSPKICPRPCSRIRAKIVSVPEVAAICSAFRFQKSSLNCPHAVIDLKSKINRVAKKDSSHLQILHVKCDLISNKVTRFFEILLMNG